MSDKLNLEANDKTLKEVLFADRKYCVPQYQRPYAWDVEQVSEFWDDLVSSDDPNFLGSFIFHTEMERKTGYADIIDGQQRLLTVTIFTAVLRDLVRQLDGETAMLYQQKDITVQDLYGQESFRMRPGDTVRDYFETHIQIGTENILDSKPATREESRVKRNYEYLYDKVSRELQRFDSKERQLDALSELRDKVSELVVRDVVITNLV